MFGVSLSLSLSLSLSSPQPPPPLFPRRMYTLADTDVYNIHTILPRVLGCYKLSNSNNRMQPFEAIHRQSVATKHEATATFYLHHTPISNQALAPLPCTCISKPLSQNKTKERSKIKKKNRWKLAALRHRMKPASTTIPVGLMIGGWSFAVLSGGSGGGLRFPWLVMQKGKVI